jgi:hypothetical protein
MSADTDAGRAAHVVMTLGKSPGVVTTALKALSCITYEDPAHDIHLPVTVQKLHLLCIPNAKPANLPEPEQLWLAEPLDAGWADVLHRQQGILAQYWPFGTKDLKGEIASCIGAAAPRLELPARGMETPTVKIWCLATGETDLVEPKDAEKFGQLCEYVLGEVFKEAEEDPSKVWVGIAGGRKHMASILHVKAAAMNSCFRLFHAVLTDDCEEAIRNSRRHEARNHGHECPEDWKGWVDMEMQPPLKEIRLVIVGPGGEMLTVRTLRRGRSLP